MTNDGSHTYQYDAENRLIKIDSGSTAQYAYGPQGERAWKVEGSETTYFYWGIAERKNGTWTKFFVQGLGGKLVEYNAGTTWFFVPNHLGSVSALMDVAGNLIDTYRYLPYGERYAGGYTRHEYTGKERDAESGLDYFGARYLSSAHGRWMSVDPAVNRSDPQRLNRYAYVLGNPINFLDPDGREGWCISVIVMGEIYVYCHGEAQPPKPETTTGTLPGSHNFFEGQQDVAEERGSEGGRPQSPHGPASQPLPSCIKDFLQPLFNFVNDMMPGFG